MEIWLSWQNNTQQLRLPILPPSFEVETGNLNTTININEIGNIKLIGKSDLKKITLETFFPARNYSFCEYTGFPQPYSCVEMIEGWRKSGKPIRLIITGTPINLAMAIEIFKFGERDGSGDVYYTLELEEYVFTQLKQVTQTSTNGYEQTNNRPAKEVANEYIVKSGDTLWEIAKRTTGNGVNYKTIAKKNNIANPNVISPGQKLVL